LKRTSKGNEKKHAKKPFEKTTQDKKMPEQEEIDRSAPTL